MQSKNFAVKVKAAGPDDGLEEGQFSAYASVFGNIDSYNDVVLKGAFTDSLAEWQASGMPIPVLWGHDTYDPFSNLGGTVSAEEDDHGLLITAQLDLENAKSQQVYRMLKGKRINQMSFAYDILDAGQGEQGGDQVQFLRKLRLLEVSVVPYGANAETEVLAVKSNAQALAAGLKVGRAISAKNETDLKDARDLIDGVLAVLDNPDDPSKASGQEHANDEEPASAPAKSDEPLVNPSVEHWASLIAIKTKEVP